MRIRCPVGQHLIDIRIHAAAGLPAPDGADVFVSNEAVGPSLFGGWAEPGDGYACSEHGCGCGWEYEYEPGEPKGIPHPTPLIQLTATSEDQVQANVYRHLKAMITLGPAVDGR